MLACYHLHFDPQLSLYKAALRRIPCACSTCLNKLALPWQEHVDAHLQPRFRHNDRCKYIKVFGDMNDWIIIDVIPNKTEDENDEMEELKKDALIGIIDRISGDIKIGQVGAFMYNKNDDEFGYDLVIWNSLPYTLQEDDKKSCLKKVDRVINVTNLYRLDNRNNWYYSSLTKSTIKLLHVVVADISMETDSIPRGFSTKNIKDNYIGKMSDRCHEFILDEINRRDRLNFYEECTIFSDDSDDESI